MDRFAFAPLMLAWSFLPLFCSAAEPKADQIENDRGPIGFHVTRVKLSGYRGLKPPVSVESADGKVVLRVDKLVMHDQRRLSLRLYDKATQKPLGLEIRVARVTALAIAADKRTIAVGDWWSDGGGHVEVWDTVTGKMLAEWSSGEVVDLKFDSKGRTVHVRCGPEPRS